MGIVLISPFNILFTLQDNTSENVFSSPWWMYLIGALLFILGIFITYKLSHKEEKNRRRNHMIKKAVIPAAGYGTRFLPITKALPKELLPIIDRPTIEYIVDEAIKSGITDILLIVSSNKNAIIDYFDYNIELETILLSKNKQEEYHLVRDIARGANLHFIRQKEQLGLGHAVLQAEAFIGDDPFAVLLGDDMYVTDKEPAIKQMMNAFETTNASILGTMEVAYEDTYKYGISALQRLKRKKVPLSRTKRLMLLKNQI